MLRALPALRASRGSYEPSPRSFPSGSRVPADPAHIGRSETALRDNAPGRAKMQSESFAKPPRRVQGTMKRRRKAPGSPSCSLKTSLEAPERGSKRSDGRSELLLILERRSRGRQILQEGNSERSRGRRRLQGEPATFARAAPRVRTIGASDGALSGRARTGPAGFQGTRGGMG